MRQTNAQGQRQGSRFQRSNPLLGTSALSYWNQNKKGSHGRRSGKCSSFLLPQAPGSTEEEKALARAQNATTTFQNLALLLPHCRQANRSSKALSKSAKTQIFFVASSEGLRYANLESLELRLLLAQTSSCFEGARMHESNVEQLSAGPQT